MAYVGVFLGKKKQTLLTKENTISHIFQNTSGFKLTHHLIEKKIIVTVKYSGGNVIVWGCSAASGSGWLAVIDGTMNSAFYSQILK